MFPLSFLRVLLSEQNRPRKEAAKQSEQLAQALIRWGYVNMAKRQWQQQLEATKAAAIGPDGKKATNVSDDGAAAILQRLDRETLQSLVESGTLPYHFQSLAEAGRSVYKAMGFQYMASNGKWTNVITPSKWAVDVRHAEALELKAKKNDAWVAIHLSVLWDLNSGRWKWDEFAVYCALLSSIGKKNVPWIVRYEAIQARVHGHLKAMPPNLVPLLSIDQIRHRITKLEARGLIGTFSERHGRNRWYWLPYRIKREAAEVYIAARQAKKADALARDDSRERVRLLRESFRSTRGQSAASHVLGQATHPPPPENLPPDLSSDDGGIPEPSPVTPPRPGPGYGATPAYKEPLPARGGAPAPPAPKVEGGVLTMNGEDWYSREYLQNHLGEDDDSETLFVTIITHFDRVEYEGETYYSARRRLSPA